MGERVIIVDYDPGWVGAFAGLCAEVLAVLGEVALGVEHVGSTSVAGLCAKPIIDIDVVVGEDGVEEAIRRLAAVGCAHQGDLGIVGREAFSGLKGKAGGAGVAAHHLYVCKAGAAPLVEHLAFRDFLRGDAETARAYGEVKRLAARFFGEDRDGYTEAKGPFVRAVLRRAGATLTRSHEATKTHEDGD